MRLDKLAKLVHNLGFFLRALLGSLPQKGPALLGRHNLVLLALAHGVHTVVPRATHDKTGTFVGGNLLSIKTDLAAPRNALAFSYKRRHRRTFAGQQPIAVLAWV